MPVNDQRLDDRFESEDQLCAQDALTTLEKFAKGYLSAVKPRLQASHWLTLPCRPLNAWFDTDVRSPANLAARLEVIGKIEAPATT